MSSQYDHKFINHLILLFVGAAIPIGILSFMNGSINWVGVLVIAVVVVGLLIYRGQLNKN
jgi:c-di-AMP phosphodiesterase-like protein